MSFDQFDDCTARGRGRPAAARLERGACDLLAVHLEVDPDEVAAWRAAGGAGAIGRRQPAFPTRRGQMVLERSHDGDGAHFFHGVKTRQVGLSA
jgi:hypothetical protein